MSSVRRHPYLILGNGPAAVNAVEAIRGRDADTPIVLVAREGEHTYSRPLITYRLGGLVDEGGMDYRGRDFYEANGVEARLGLEAVKVDSDSRTVLCGDGSRLGFEKLLIATGGAPIRPAIAGLDSAGVFTFTTWSDERAVEAYIESRRVRRAVVLGGGLIGLKCVEALHRRGLEVTVVELADRILPACLDADASRLAEGALRRAGVNVRTGLTVRKALRRRRAIAGVQLADGTRLTCELLVVAIGVRPELALVAGTGIRIDRGIRVDERMATSAEGIYAAGDVAQAADAVGGQSRPVPILPAAARQGRVAGTNMAGGDARYDGALAMNAVDVLGLATISVGQAIEAEGDQVLRRLDEKHNAYRKIVLRDNRIVGAIFVGNIGRAGIFTGLIRSRVDVGGFKDLLLGDAFGLLSLPADYRAHMVSGAGIEV